MQTRSLSSGDARPRDRPAASPRAPTRPQMAVPYWASLLLISAQGVTNWGFRSALPAWIPLLCADQSFTDAQRALLMSSFFPGCASPPAEGQGQGVGAGLTQCVCRLQTS